MKGMHKLLPVSLTALLLTAQAAAAKTVTLRYWIWDNNQFPAVKTMVDMFTKQNPSIKVKVEVVADYWTKLLASLAGGVAPDVWWINMPTFSVWARKGMLADLQPFVNSDKEARETVRSIWNVLMKSYTYKGRIYGMPRDYDTIAVLYNESAMQAAGIQAPMGIENTWDWNTLATYAKKLTLGQDGKIKQWGFFSTGSDQESWLNWIYSNGGDVFKWNDDGSDECILNSPKSVQAVQWLADRKLKDGTSPDDKAMAAGLDGLWTSGKLAMMTRGDWNLLSLNSATKKFKWNIAQLPFDPNNGKRVSVIHGLADVINPTSKYKKEAFAFVKFLASREAQRILGNTGTVIPSRTDTERLFFSEKLNPSNRKAYEKAVDYSMSYPMSRKVIYAYAAPVLANWVNQAFAGRMPATTALDRAAQEMNALIKRYSK